MGSELAGLLRTSDVSLPNGLTAPDHRDTTKFRVYAYRGEGQMPLLKHRFDLDRQAGDWQMPSLDSLEHGWRPDLVVVSDFMKGTINADRWTALAQSSGAVPWLVDSKNPLIVDYSVAPSGPRPTLFVNREEFERLIAQKLPAAGSSRPTRLDGPWHHIETHVLEAALRFADKFGAWDLVVKLDSSGAVAFWKVAGGVLKFAHRKAVERDGQVVGIGAGDAFLAGWAAATLDKADHERRLDRAIGHAAAWIATAEASPRLTWPRDVKKQTIKKSEAAARALPRTQQIAVETRLKDLRKNKNLQTLITSKVIDLARAGGHCGKFMTMNVEVGNKVRSFATEIGRSSIPKVSGTRSTPWSGPSPAVASRSWSKKWQGMSAPSSSRSTSPKWSASMRFVRQWSVRATRTKPRCW